jgi:tRNA pseudouridine13 synthase
MESAEPPAPPWAPGLRYLTQDEPPIDLRFKQELEDFVVEELPAFEPSGSGEHLWLFIEKRALSTLELVRAATRALGLAARDVGWAGRKDVRAVTRQWLSLRGVGEADARRLESDRISVLRVTRHERKLRLGQLAGNRFELLLRGVPAADRGRAERSLARLEARGLPNYFGAQRFGLRGFAFELGRLLLEGRAREYLLALTGPRHALDRPALQELHGAIADGQRAALRCLAALAPQLPPEFGALARQLARRPGDWNSALRALDRPTLSFHLSALQSRIFNRVLAARLEDFDRPRAGDLCVLHPTRSFFEVTAAEDRDELARRAAAFEISPSGPLPGARVPLAGGSAGVLEVDALRAEGLGAGATEFDLSALRGVDLPGGRRSLRARIAGLRHEWRAEGLWLGFSLPTGSYATVLIAELSKRP